MTVLRFRSFRRLLLAAILTLTAGAQLAAFVIVRHLHRTHAEEDMDTQLKAAAKSFDRQVALRTSDLARSGDATSFYEGLRGALSHRTDVATLRSALDSVQDRGGADVVALLSLDGHVLAETRHGSTAEAVYRPLQQLADQADSAQAKGYGLIDGALFSIAVVPLRAPDITAWIAIGFRIDQDFIRKLKESTGVEITIQRAGHNLASTIEHPATNYDTVNRTLPTVTGDTVDIALQYSRDEKLAPARRLEAILALVFAGNLLVACLIALAIARGVSEPVQQLAAHTRKIAAGDYTTRVTLDRSDELGQLADGFNAMAVGLAERDRVRDLLDKNVSPEIAAQLMRDGAALGGEEREVTVLFADLRGFTALSEKLSPQELLTLLNRYLDRMSREIEQRGGVIDKFIGDAVMALFGAPIDQGDAAERAIASALAMERALARFNEELAAEAGASRPTGELSLGIGINTARVIAGNIGSQRRLNYSVVGDGVNVASRLQALTRAPEYATNIIVSAGTVAALRHRDLFRLRPLGTAQVKGRAEAVEIFAVEGSTSPASTKSL